MSAGQTKNAEAPPVLVVERGAGRIDSLDDCQMIFVRGEIHAPICHVRAPRQLLAGAGDALLACINGRTSSHTRAAISSR